MKGKFGDILFIVLVVIIAIWSTLLLAYKYPNNIKIKANKHIDATIEGVVVQVNGNGLLLYSKEGLLNSVVISETKKDKFMQGQEIKVYYHGLVTPITEGKFLKRINDVSNIKILKQQSNMEIPDKVLRFCYSSLDKVSIKIDELTKTGIKFTIVDENDLTYDYNLFNDSNNYELYKKVGKNKYTGDEYIKIEKRASIKNNGETFVNDEGTTIFRKQFDWSKLYGELESGEYFLSINSNVSSAIKIELDFTIDKNGNIVFEVPKVSANF